MEIISRNDAFEKGLTKFFTGKFCRNNHLAERFVSNGSCTKCYKSYKKTKFTKTAQHNMYRVKRLEVFYYTDADREMIEQFAAALLEASKPAEADGAAIREAIYAAPGNVQLLASIDTAQDKRDNAPSHTPLQPVNY